MSLFSSDDDLQSLAAELGRCLQQREFVIATAESCTGGWVAKILTDIPGSSAWFDRGFVTYSNEAKQEMLGVDPEIIDANGAVSEATARAMAEGVLNNSRASVSLAITGIAGPGGGTPYKPVGLVWFAWAGGGQPVGSVDHIFEGDRESIRRQAVLRALHGVRDRLDGC
ncbi:MAG: CinA family protein [Gammaproteobacteria bacterium]|nr:CinA family protein [Gammaproteobacteria bacterium]MDH5651365.1 CinA family protein [Gammaproteobacteria bacterium]